MKYNTAVLRSRRLQKHVTDLSLVSLPVEDTATRRRLSDDSRYFRGAADSQILGTRSYHRPTTYSTESAHGGTMPADYRRLYSKPVTCQNKADLTLASRTCVGNVSRTGDGSRHTVAPVMYATERTGSDKTVAKNSARIVSGESVSLGIPLSLEEAHRLLLERENAKLLETYATLPRKSWKQKAALQHRQKFTEMQQQTFHSGISHPSGYVSQKACIQKDKPSSPIYDSLSHLKITWLVFNMLTLLCI